jgi:2,4-dienoyl-CoA reductase-like NADH-dependent reductase (Old Yellow Enzyme family)
MSKLWSPIAMGRVRLAHRLAMAPMTRNRALPDGSPTELDALYFAQRASLGLLIAGGTQPSADGQGFLLTHGSYTDAHIAGWRKVTDAVHEAGGHLFVQLMHAGRIAHPDNTPHHRQPVAPSAINPGVAVFTATGPQDVPTPRALTTDEVTATVADFRHAAATAVAAGADGVEIHGFNGFLVHQFLAANTNRRTDRYGGSVAARARFAVEVATAVADEIGADRTGIRLSPGTTSFGINEGDTGPDTYRHLVGELAGLDLAYLHLRHEGDEELLRDLRKAWPNPLLLNRPGRHHATLADDVDAGLADVVPVGGLALSNPDLVERLREGSPLNEPRRETFYGGDETGYTDYPTSKEP